MFLVPVNRHLVFRTFRLSRLESSHFFRLLRSWVRDENSSVFRSLEANARRVSYIQLTSDRSLPFGRSLMCNRNSRGSRIEPWDTPQRMRLVSDLNIINNCNLSSVVSKKIQTCTFEIVFNPFTPKLSSFDE